MSNTITLPHQLRSLAGNRDHLKLALTLLAGEHRTLGLLLSLADQEAPGIKDRLLDTEGRLRRFINIYVDGQDARVLADRQIQERHKVEPANHIEPNPLEVLLTGYEEIAILPSIAGG